MPLRTRLKQTAPPNSTRFISRYLDELIDYGGEPYTRAEAILHMQSLGLNQPAIDRWLQGNELAQRLREQRARIATRLILPAAPCARRASNPQNARPAP